MSAGQLIWPYGAAQLVPFRICRQGCVNRTAVAQMVTGSGLLWAAVSASARRLSMIATGAMASWHRPYLLPPSTETKEDPHPQQKTVNTPETTEGWGGSHPARNSRCTVQQTSHGSPMLAFFWFGGGGVGGEITSHGSPMSVNWSPPFNPGIFQHEISEICHLTTWIYLPPTCFFGLLKDGGGLPDATF